MEKRVLLVLFLMLSLCLMGCRATQEELGLSSDSAASVQTQETLPQGSLSSPEILESSQAPNGQISTNRQIRMRFGENTVLFELNDSTAATSLYKQLPLTVDITDYSTNEKIFYPPQKLDTTNTPLAQSGAGTLAYYAPWGDVVLFYGDYGENPALFELGQVVSGKEQIQEMTGTVTIEVAE